MIAADSTCIENAIRCGGLAQTKASCIKNLLRCLVEKKEKVCLEYLRDLSVDEIKAELSHFRGIGPKMVPIDSCYMGSNNSAFLQQDLQEVNLFQGYHQRHIVDDLELEMSDPRGALHRALTIFKKLKAPFSSRKEFEGKSFPMSFSEGWKMEYSFPTFGNAGKVIGRYHFISFPMLVLSMNGKQSLYNFSIKPILNQIKKNNAFNDIL